ncbi:hypothetical protein [Caulobacter hibisci]|uniref:Uncharacterized protein n=1 Tax=Caulobacter hibisci TaxID=2035993 RepID=A0ABS0SVM9_9CAUL|nr:hypothetical protein [Caulobacter hibisci]MBI1683659.1 hypothetical protein [Caulobacter hibisci]
MSGGVDAETHELQCVADCGIVMPLPIEAYASIPLLALVIAVAWIALRRLARRKRAPSKADRTGRNSRSPPAGVSRNYWRVDEPGKLHVYLNAEEAEVREYCEGTDRTFARLSEEKVREIGEEWLYDRLSRSLRRQPDGSLKAVPG